MTAQKKGAPREGAQQNKINNMDYTDAKPAPARAFGAIERIRWLVAVHAQHKELTKSALIVATVLADFANSNSGKAFPSHLTIMRSVNLPRPSVTRAIKKLEQLGFIRRVEGGKAFGRVVVYRLDMSVIAANDERIAAQVGRSFDTPQEGEVYQSSDTGGCIKAVIQGVYQSSDTGVYQSCDTQSLNPSPEGNGGEGLIEGSRCSPSVAVAPSGSHARLTDKHGGNDPVASDRCPVSLPVDQLQPGSGAFESFWEAVGQRRDVYETEVALIEQLKSGVSIATIVEGAKRMMAHRAATNPKRVMSPLKFVQDRRYLDGWEVAPPKTKAKPAQKRSEPSQTKKIKPTKPTPPTATETPHTGSETVSGEDGDPERWDIRYESPREDVLYVARGAACRLLIGTERQSSIWAERKTGKQPQTPAATPQQYREMITARAIAEGWAQDAMSILNAHMDAAQAINDSPDFDSLALARYREHTERVIAYEIHGSSDHAETEVERLLSTGHHNTLAAAVSTSARDAFARHVESCDDCKAVAAQIKSTFDELYVDTAPDILIQCAAPDALPPEAAPLLTAARQESIQAELFSGDFIELYLSLIDREATNFINKTGAFAT